MALRARLVAPPLPETRDWPWHTTKTTSIPVSALWSGDRRLEAETYLSSGYGFRTAIEAKSKGWKRFGEIARVWQPSRLKGIQVSKEFGTPFIAATQVFDVRPIPRKWLSLDRTDDATNRFVNAGTILVTCSGSVGRPALAYNALDGILVSHDLLRVDPVDSAQRGWLYAYLHSRQVRAMATGAHYGHIIKHLETSHLEALPIPNVTDSQAEELAEQVDQILRLRNEGNRLTAEAEKLFGQSLGPVEVKDWGEGGFSVKASSAIFGNRRRFDASIHNPGVHAIREHLAKRGSGFTRLSDAGFEVWLPTRFRRVPAEDGVLLVDSADLTEVNPDLTKRIADIDFGDSHKGRVKAGWVLMARSGQTYGIIGTAILAQDDLEDKVVSDHVMRIKPKPNCSMRPGYLVTAMTHPMLGRPLVKALAYGSSIPEIEVADIESLQVVRLGSSKEAAIAEYAEGAAANRSKADSLERKIGETATAIVGRFIA